MTDLVLRNQDNMDKECANVRCNFQRRGMKVKATHYDTHNQSWVCSCCAQAINREALGRQRASPKFKQRCITGEDATMMMLTNGVV